MPTHTTSPAPTGGAPADLSEAPDLVAALRRYATDMHHEPGVLGPCQASVVEDAADLLAALVADVESAAGECLIDVPEPGTDLARVCLANRQLRRQRDQAQENVAALSEALRDLLDTSGASTGTTPSVRRAADLLAALATPTPAAPGAVDRG